MMVPVGHGMTRRNSEKMETLSKTATAKKKAPQDKCPEGLTLPVAGAGFEPTTFGL